MSRSKPSADSLGRPDEEELSDFSSDTDTDNSGQKDHTEKELEKLVFGNAKGFRKGLKTHPKSAALSSSIKEGDVQDLLLNKSVADNIQDADDTDLFFLDSEPSLDLQPVTTSHAGKLSQGDPDEAAWFDSDDERIIVSLRANPRLRKLRLTEDEDLVNGTEYTQRLQQQFKRLYPLPEWASVPYRKRRRLSKSSQILSEESTSADDKSVSSGELFAQPLAKLLQNTPSLTTPKLHEAKSRRKLRPEVLDIQRIKDVGIAQPVSNIVFKLIVGDIRLKLKHQSAIVSLSFHPHHPLLLSSGPSSTLMLHHISPRPPNPNPLVTSVHVSSTPLSTSSFLPPGGEKILFSGRRRFFHSWDLASGRIDKISRVYGHQNEQKSMERFKLSPCGRWMALVGSERKGGGLVNILDASTSQWVAEVRVESQGGVADFAWWADGNGITVLGKGGQALEWDGQERKTVGRWTDEGAIGTTVVSMSGRGGGVGGSDLGPDRWIAVGSSSGIVNIYDRGHWKTSNLPANPKPSRALDQLTTPISHLMFSPDGQLLVMASRWKRDALRLVHLPSCTVYRNWPTSTTPIGRATSVAFSPSSEMLAVANEQGKIRLWEIQT